MMKAIVVIIGVLCITALFITAMNNMNKLDIAKQELDFAHEYDIGFVKGRIDCNRDFDNLFCDVEDPEQLKIMMDITCGKEVIR